MSSPRESLRAGCVRGRRVVGRPATAALGRDDGRPDDPGVVAQRCRARPRISTVSRGMNLSALLLTPPPRIMRLGHISCWIRSRCSSRSAAHAFHDSPRLTRAAAADRRSAARPRISIWPNSVFGTSTPSTNTPDPTPVPRVRKMTTPGLSFPTPKRISAIPAASASLMMKTGRLSSLPIRSTTGKSIQAGSMLRGGLQRAVDGHAGQADADRGRRRRGRSDLTRRLTSRRDRGDDGLRGRGHRASARGAAPSAAVRHSTSTTAALIPLPPTSMPMAMPAAGHLRTRRRSSMASRSDAQK